MGMHQGYVLPPFYITVVVDVVTEIAREGVLSELSYADDLVLTSETIEGLWDTFLKWKEALDSKGLQVNHGKIKVMASGGITKGGMSKSKVDPCGVCSLSVKPNSALCLHCGKWIHGRCAGVERLQRFQETLHVENVKGILERQWNRKKSYVMRWKL